MTHPPRLQGDGEVVEDGEVDCKRDCEALTKDEYVDELEETSVGGVVEPHRLVEELGNLR